MMLKKTEIDRCRRARPELTLIEALEDHIKKDSLPVESQETLLNEMKELFLAYWADTSDNIVTVPAMDAAELVLKNIRRWSNKAKSRKAAGAANVSLIEKLQSLRAELVVAEEEINRLSQLNQSDSGTGKEIDPNLLKAIEDKDQLAGELKQAQEELKKMEDLQLMLDGAKLQIRDG